MTHLTCEIFRQTALESSAKIKIKMKIIGIIGFIVLLLSIAKAASDASSFKAETSAIRDEYKRLVTTLFMKKIHDGAVSMTTAKSAPAADHWLKTTTDSLPEEITEKAWFPQTTTEKSSSSTFDPVTDAPTITTEETTMIPKIETKRAKAATGGISYHPQFTVKYFFSHPLFLALVLFTLVLVPFLIVIGICIPQYQKRQQQRHSSGQH